MHLKHLMFALVVFGASLSLFAGNTYYVDAKNGNDLWDGSCAEHVDGTTQGPKETLAEVMALTTANNGDIVYALPGVYSNKTMAVTEKIGNESVSVLNRVVVKAGVQLISTEGAEKTFILGEADPKEPLWNGCGTNSVRCVYMCSGWDGNGSRLVGFTVTGGRAYYRSASAAAEGGGFNCKGRQSAYMDCSCVENCIISNNVAYTYGAGIRGAYIGCRIVDNRASSAPGVAGWNELFLYDCFVKGNTASSSSYQVIQPRYCYNTTCVGDVQLANGKNDNYNSVFLGYISCYGGGTGYYYKNCVFRKGDGNDEYAGWNNNTVQILPAADINLGADGYPLSGSKLINTGSNNYHVVTAGCFPTKSETLTDYWPGPHLTKDAYGRRRINGATIDIGGCEYDSNKDFSAAFDPMGDVSVTNTSWNVSLTEEKKVHLPTNTTLALTWKPRVGTSANYRFRARVTGTGTLTILKDGEAWQTLTAADGEKWYSVIKEGALGLDFAYAAGADDEGGADLWDFTNVAYAIITVADGGVVLDGAVVGTNYVAAGGTLTFTATRAFDRADLICTGVTSNGVFYAFDDYPNGLTFSVVDANREMLRLEAVYDTMVTGTWYVDAVNGKDSGNYGHHRLNAFKTLAEAMSHAKSGEIVYVLPGVYSNGTMTTTESLGGVNTPVLNRVEIPAGVQLLSTEGAEKTVILGAADPTNPLWNGCGTNSVRCVYMHSGWDGNGSRLVGFTVTGGRACYRSSSAAASGGGFFCRGRAAADMNASCIEDCIISNNVAYTSGAGVQGAYTRCRIVNNRANTYPGITGRNELFIYDCFLKGNTANSWSLQADQPRVAYNTTFVGSTGLSGAVNDNRNSVFLGGITLWGGGTAFYFKNCVFRKGDGNDVLATYNNNDVQILSTADINLDADGYPIVGSKLIDGGTNSYHVVTAGNFPTRTRTSTDYWPGYNLQKDAYGAQRTYNGTIDIGGCEYDWRGTYTKDLGRRVVVTQASENVVETNGLVRVTDGESLTLAARGWTGRPLSLSATVSGAGMLTIKRGDTVLGTLTAGTPTCSFKVVADPDEIKAVFEGDGYADLAAVRSGEGLMLIVR